jgi:hypothetical protein
MRVHSKARCGKALASQQNLEIKVKTIAVWVLSLSLVGLANETRAATFCVSTGTELRTALMTASANDEADTIKIEVGTYTSTGGAPIAFAYSTAQNFTLIVAGGYVSHPPQMCDQQLDQPEATVLSGSNAKQVMQLYGSPGTIGGQSLSNLTIRDGFTSESGGGLYIGGSGGFTGNVLVRRVIIERNVSSMFGGGMTLYTEGLVNVRNSMFLLNRCGITNCAITATVNAASPATTRAFFGNNTIVGNQCTSGSSCTVTGARFGGSARAVFYNNVFAANSNGDLDLFSFSGGTVDLYYNNLVTRTGTAPTTMVGNIAYANPQFVDLLNDDFRPTLGSPLRNAGTDQFALEPIDLAGELRINENRVDIGAYENSDRIFADAFDLFE